MDGAVFDGAHRKPKRKKIGATQQQDRHSPSNHSTRRQVKILLYISPLSPFLAFPFLFSFFIDTLSLEIYFHSFTSLPSCPTIAAATVAPFRIPPAHRLPVLAASTVSRSSRVHRCHITAAAFNATDLLVSRRFGALFSSSTLPASSPSSISCVPT